MESKKASIRSAVIIAAAVIILWTALGATDYFRVKSFEKPIFAIVKSSEPGSSEDYLLYRGLGYSIEIAGNFDQSSEYPGVTRYTYFLFGKEICAGLRD